MPSCGRYGRFGINASHRRAKGNPSVAASKVSSANCVAVTTDDESSAAHADHGRGGACFLMQSRFLTIAYDG